MNGQFSVMCLFVSVIATTSIAVDATSIHHALDQQTALLQQIVANTKAPVAVQVSGFSPEAQKVFKKALEKGGKAK